MLANAILPTVYRSCALFAFTLIAMSTLELYFATIMPYSGILLHVYLSIGLLVALFAYLHHVLQRSARDATLTALEQTAAGLARERLPFLTKIRAYLSEFATAIILILCWPVIIFSIPTLKLASLPSQPAGQLQLSAASSLFLFDTSISVYTMLGGICFTLLALNGEPPFLYSLYFIAMLAVVTGLRHLIYIIGVETVQKRLRRSWGNPFMRFVCKLLKASSAL